MPFKIVKNDIASMTADAIVYANTPQPFMLFNFNPLLYDKKGKELVKSRDKLGSLIIGEAKIVPIDTLDAKYIIHTSAPIWHGGKYSELMLLRSCYEKVFQLAVESQCKSIALPIIGADNLGYPKKLTQQTAFECIRDFLLTHDLDVSLVVPGKASILLPGNQYSQVNSYINKNFVKGNENAELDNKEIADNPSKINIISLGISRKLSLAEMKDFVESSGHSMTHSSKFDLIIEYCILNNIYDVWEINMILFRFEQELLDA